MTVPLEPLTSCKVTGLLVTASTSVKSGAIVPKGSMFEGVRAMFVFTKISDYLCYKVTTSQRIYKVLLESL